MHGEHTDTKRLQPFEIIPIVKCTLVRVGVDVKGTPHNGQKESAMLLMQRTFVDEGCKGKNDEIFCGRQYDQLWIIIMWKVCWSYSILVYGSGYPAQG
jgi:hypothetical protein